MGGVKIVRIPIQRLPEYFCRIEWRHDAAYVFYVMN